MLNILFLSAWYPCPADNGSKIRVLALLRHLATRHRVTLVAFVFGTAAPKDVDEVHHLCDEVHLLYLDPIARSQRGTLQTFLSLTPSAARSVPQMQALVNHVATSDDFDVVIASTMTMSAYALKLPLVRILEEHNSLSRWMSERLLAQSSRLPKARCWVSWQKARWAEARLYRCFDLVTMVSREDRQAANAVLDSNANRLATVPNGVDCQHNYPGLAHPAQYHLVFNGSLSYAANFNAMRWFLAEVYPAIRRACSAVTLSITGSTAGVDLSALPMYPGVKLTGFVDDIRLEVAGAVACIAPIREGGGSRLKILEAMALGTPVVATSKGVEGLDITPGEHLLVADDPYTFARYTVDLLTDSSLCDKLAASARALVEECYDWREIGSGFVELVEKTVDRSRNLRR